MINLDSLDEVIVLGYGTQNKKEKYYGIITINPKVTPPQEDLNSFIIWVQNSFDITKLKTEKRINIFVEFIIDKKTQITDIKIVNKNKRRIKKEIQRIFMISAIWTPAIENGIPVEEKILLNFDISNED